MLAAVSFNRPDLALKLVGDELAELRKNREMVYLAKAHAQWRLRDYPAAEAGAMSVLGSAMELHRRRQQMGLDQVPVASDGAGGMFLAYGFNLLADIYLAQRRFDEALLAANASLAYRQQRSPALLTKAFALWGLDRVDEGRTAYEAAIRGYIPVARLEAAELKEDFLRQLCLKNPTDLKVCTVS
jgi:tetratricopeptide (TPR) repeat protein